MIILYVKRYKILSPAVHLDSAKAVMPTIGVLNRNYCYSYFIFKGSRLPSVRLRQIDVCLNDGCYQLIAYYIITL